jgi:type I restriction enzyme S subunit
VDGPFGSSLQRKDYTFEGVPVLKIQNIKPFSVELKKMDYVTSAKFRELSRHSYSSGDIVMTKLGSPLGVSAIVEGLPEGLIVADLVRIRAKRIDTKYLCYHLNSPQTSDFINSMQKGSTRPRVTLSVVRELPIACPSLPEQQRIVAILDEAFDGIARAKANAEQNLKNARELFESHLQAVFTQRGEGWEGKTLSQVALDFGRGKSRHRPRNDPKLYGGPYPFIQTGDVRNSEHLITEYTQTYSAEGLAQSKLWPKGTLCITIAANIAETGILNFDACFPDSVIGIVVDQKQTSNHFLEYLLQAVKAVLKAKGKGSAQDNINLGTFENELFFFPNLATQAQITRQLDDLSTEVQRLESTYQQKLGALDELKKSLLHKAFSGEL